MKIAAFLGVLFFLLAAQGPWTAAQADEKNPNEVIVTTTLEPVR